MGNDPSSNAEALYEHWESRFYDPARPDIAVLFTKNFIAGWSDSDPTFTPELEKFSLEIAVHMLEIVKLLDAQTVEKMADLLSDSGWDDWRVPPHADSSRPRVPFSEDYVSGSDAGDDTWTD